MATRCRASASVVPETYRVVGPPGTGKTTALARTVETWIDRDGYKPEDFTLTSYTRSAAAVLRGRIAIPDEQAATLHALAYRMLGRPPLAEKGDLAKAWNADAPDSWKVGAASSEEDGLAMPDAEIGEQMRLYSLARMRMLPLAHPLHVQTRDFAEAWETFKTRTGSIDFVDMLEYALMETPLRIGAFIVDEAQDLVPLQWALARHWGSVADRFVVGGDPAQTLYSFAGSRPDDMLNPLPDEHLWNLPQSYRLPRAIQTHAETYLRRHSGALPIGREYAARAEEGAVRSLGATWRRPEVLLDAIDRDPRPCMVLASCSFMLQPTIALLREAGIPFENEYRRSAAGWNPLGSLAHAVGEGESSSRSTAKMVAAFADGLPAGEWVELLLANTFLMRSAKKMIADGGEDVEGMLKPEHRAAYSARDLDWLGQRMLAQYAKPAAFAMQVIARGGTEALRRKPKIMIGSIHSAKGSERPVTYLYPDLSIAGGNEQQSSQEGADAAVRLGYVALTRASEEVVLLDAADQRRTMW